MKLPKSDIRFTLITALGKMLPGPLVVFVMDFVQDCLCCKSEPLERIFFNGHLGAQLSESLGFYLVVELGSCPQEVLILVMVKNHAEFVKEKLRLELRILFCSTSLIDGKFTLTRDGSK